MNKRDRITRDEASPSTAESSPAEPRRESQDGAHPKAMITAEYKHSIATRWMHWINFLLLFLMIYSGILIYWADSQHEGLNAHRVYRIGFGDWTLVRLFPSWFYNSLHLKFQLARGLAYLLHVVLRTEWSRLCPLHVFVRLVAQLSAKSAVVRGSDSNRFARPGNEQL